MASVWGELKRRNVVRVAVAYAIVSWLILQLTDILVPMLNLPESVGRLVFLLLLVGFPLAMFFAWAFELTPEGLKKEKDVDRSESVTHHTGRKLDFAIIGLMAVAILYLVLDNYVLDKAPSEIADEVAQESITAPADSDKSIAVLPFRNRSAVAEDAYFVDGIHNDILTQLAKLSSLDKVISRTSMEQYRETTKPMPQIGQELGVGIILEGGVQRAGDRVRINVQLIDAATDEHLWAESYDRQLTVENIFAIQSEIATAIVEALKATLSAEERDSLAAVPTENMAALEKYFLGKERLEKRTTSAFAEAIDYFQTAIDLDPNFALAYVGLANGYTLQAEYAGLSFAEELPKAKAMVLKALDLDDRLGEAYAVLGLIETGTNNSAAEAAFQRGIALNPGSVNAYFWYCLLLGDYSGRYAEALPLCERALELDPLSAIVKANHGVILGAVGRPEEAQSQYRRVIEINPGFAFAYELLGDAYWNANAQLDEAVRWYRQAIELDPGTIRRLAWLGEIYLDLGDPDQAEYWYSRAINRGPADASANFGMSSLNLYRGDYAAASEYARKAFESGGVAVWSINLTPIRDHELRAGRYADARAFYDENYPVFLNDEKPEITFLNYRPAIDLALVLSRTGEQERANLLLNLALQYIRTVPTESFWYSGYGIADVQIYALQGDNRKALSSLRQAIDKGWRARWWHDLKHDLNLESIRDEPEFQAMVKEIEADMAEQLARVREWDANGELAPIPKSLE